MTSDGESTFADDRLLSPERVSRILGVTPATLAVWRSTGRYPLKFVRVGRKIMYRRQAVDEFIDSRTMDHT